MLKLFLTGALVLVSLFVLIRIIRKGRGRNYGESKKAFAERLRKTKSQTREYRTSHCAAQEARP
jgi:hypothetical protein